MSASETTDTNEPTSAAGRWPTRDFGHNPRPTNSAPRGPTGDALSREHPATHGVATAQQPVGDPSRRLAQVANSANRPRRDVAHSGGETRPRGGGGRVFGRRALWAVPCPAYYHRGRFHREYGVSAARCENRRSRTRAVPKNHIIKFQKLAAARPCRRMGRFRRSGDPTETAARVSRRVRVDT